MKFTLDDPEEVLEYVREPLSAVREALDDGISYADSVLKGDLPYDAHYWSHAVRYLAAHRLHQAGHEGWEMGRKLRNSGMELRRGPVVMRVLKAQYGGPPHPGASLSRRGFYRQQLIPLPLDWEKVDVTEGAFLLIDWSMGEKREVLLGLSKPAGVWNFQGQPKTEWHMPVEFDSGGDPKFPTTLDEELYVTPIFELDDEEISGPGSAA